MKDPEPVQKYIKKRVGLNVSETRPKVSVVIPAYKVTEFIAEALDSVLGQKFREHEIIVVNDGSPDTPQLENALSPYFENLTYIRQRNAGAGAARNTGIENARGDIIAFLDADDVWQPDFLTSQYVFLGRHHYDLVYCDAVLFGMRSAYRRTFMETAPSEGEANFNSLLDFRCNVITSGTLARKQAIIDAGMFENEKVRAHDFHLWLRMAKNGAKIGYQQKQLLRYRVRPDSLSGDSVSRVERELEAFDRVRRSIELDDEQKQILERRVAGLESDLAVEQGKSFLLRGDFQEAILAFRVANRYRRSFKLKMIILMTRLAPKTFLKIYKRRRAADIPFVPKTERSG